MLENERKNYEDRIQNLEQRVQLQNDELIVLKSALADLIRRMQSVETIQQQHQQQIYTQLNHSNTSSSHHPKQILPLVNKSVKKSREFDSRSVGSISENLSNHIKETSRASVSRQDARSTVSIKSSSSEKLTVSTSSGDKTPTKSSKLQTNGDFAFNSDNGLVKFHLRGRPITFYLPNSSQSAPNEIGYSFDLENKLKQPKQQLKLEWVYGYRGKDCRSNLYQLPTGEIIYCIAAIIVLYNVDERVQRFYLGHTDDVRALAIHPDKITIATGQSAGHDKLEGRAHVRIWDSLTLNTLKIIGIHNNEFNNSICCLSFSKADGGQQLAVVDDGNEKWLSVWNWQNQQKTSSVKCYGDLVFAAEFSPVDKNLIVTCGKQHIAFWTQDGAHLNKRMGLFENSSTAGSNFKIEKPKYILCCKSKKR